MAHDLKQTPLHAEHQRLGARLVPFAGYAMPIQYAGIAAEHQAVRQRAGLFDVSHMGELEITGAGACELVNELVTNDLGRVSDGRAMYTCCCNEQGTILDDLIVYRFGPERVLVVCNAGNHAKISAYFREAAAGRCGFADKSEQTALLALQGPRALGILAAASSTLDVAQQLPSFHFAEARVGDVACLMARTGYTGEDGVELFCDAGHARTLWTTLLEAGQPHGLEPAGLGARDTLRLEARLLLYGNDIDESINPLEAGLGWTVKLDKPDFVGKRALLAIRDAGLQRRLVGFEMLGRGIARHGYPLLDRSGTPVGVCTSGAPSPTLGKNIGLGYLPVEMSPVGQEFAVDCRGKPVAAKVVQTPFYKRPG